MGYFDLSEFAYLKGTRASLGKILENASGNEIDMGVFVGKARHESRRRRPSR
jgi:hypothetical protein